MFSFINSVFQGLIDDVLPHYNSIYREVPLGSSFPVGTLKMAIASLFFQNYLQPKITQFYWSTYICDIYALFGGMGTSKSRNMASIWEKVPVSGYVFSLTGPSVFCEVFANFSIISIICLKAECAIIFSLFDQLFSYIQFKFVWLFVKIIGSIQRPRFVLARAT